MTLPHLYIGPPLYYCIMYWAADWAGEVEGRRSTGGYVVKYNGAAISWSSQLQAVVACSSCESEYISCSEAGREVSYLRELASFVNSAQPGPTHIYTDNQGALSLIETGTAHKRTKHISVKAHWIRAAQENGTIKVMKVHTDDNFSDIMTKGTTTGTFVKHVANLMVGPAAAAATAAAVAEPAAAKGTAAAAATAAAVAEPAAAAAERVVAAKPAAAHAAASSKPRAGKQAAKARQGPRGAADIAHAGAGALTRFQSARRRQRGWYARQRRGVLDYGDLTLIHAPAPWG
jgi:hypothetical protein